LCPTQSDWTQCGSQSASAQYVYTYDGNGKRVEKLKADGSSTIYVYDGGGNLAAEYGGQASSGTEYLIADPLGSTRMVISGSTGNLGCPTSRQDYLPFGFDIPATVGSLRQGVTDCGTSVYGLDAGVTQKFTGKERDAESASWAAQGLDYFGARYFSGAQGRFTSPDQPLIGQTPTNPQSWNLYSYALNNPLRYVDPTGHDPDPANDDHKLPVKYSEEYLQMQRDAARAAAISALPPGGQGLGDKFIDDAAANLKVLGNSAIGLLNLFGADISPMQPTNQSQAGAMAVASASAALPGPGMMMLPEGVAPQLAEFVAGGKTSGVLRTAAGDTELLSGWEGPASSMPRGSAGFDIVTRTHVEGHAAALMGQQGVGEGTLFINNPSICTSCTKLLPSMLPPGVNLKVVLPNGSTVPFTGRIP